MSVNRNKKRLLPVATVAWLQTHIQLSKQEYVTVNASKTEKLLVAACRHKKCDS
jgi:hypothetical protein